ncbi:MAG: DUF1156 domain-containing protein [Anaerolineae bacterium]|nr:DUF1156 domain-containing protein [Anaerolineae bacterium]
MPPRKKLIEVALPLEAINEASAREKSIRHGHPSTLHLWWARRPLAACRAVIFSSLVDDPDSPDALPSFVEACKALPKGPNATLDDTPRMRLFDFIERLVQWESTTDEVILNQARELIQIATEGNPPPLLDPFAGGGSIPLEAQRLGLEAHASDLNPVAVMINKAQIEIPPRFANRPPVNPRDRERMDNTQGWRAAAGLAADVRYYGEWMRDRAWERIGHLYPKHNGETVIAWIWARTVKCPNPTCGAQMPLVSSFELSKKTGRKTWVEPIIDKEAKTIRFEVRTGEGKVPVPPKIGRGAKFRCLVCGEVAPDHHIKSEGMAKHLNAQLMAVVTEGNNGRNYHSPSPSHVRSAAKAIPSWEPSGELADDPRNIWCKQYGLIEYSDLFTPRQLVALTTFSDLVAEARTQILQDALAAGLPDDDVPLRDGGTGARAYAEAVSVYLAFAVDRLAEKCNSLSSWQNSADKIRGIFARQAIAMVWDYADVNPFSGSTGNFGDALVWISQVLESTKIDFLSNYTINNVVQRDATNLDISGTWMVISTDPPYYDNIGYADLSDFFYVWMRRNLRDVFPHIFGTMLVPKEPELIASPYRHGGKEAANVHFETGLSATFIKVRRMVSGDYPLTVYYAFKQQDAEANDEDGEIDTVGVSSTGWETILSSLIDAGFSIDGTWPVRTERGGRTNEIGSNALASSIVLVCRPRAEDAPTISRRQFLEALRREMPAALKNLQSGNIAPVDLAQASIGPGMAVYSRCTKIIEADGSPMSVRTALGLINQELDTFLAEQDGDIDPETRFAVSWFEQFGFKEGEFGVADVLARAKNTSVAGIEASGVVESGRGKVKLRHWKDYDPGAWDPQQDRRPTIWEAVHHLIERLNTHGETGAALLLVKMPHEMAAEARNLAYRLYSICERKSWAENARDYNALVISWAGVGEEAGRIRDAQARNQATEQLRLIDEE